MYSSVKRTAHQKRLGFQGKRYVNPEVNALKARSPKPLENPVEGLQSWAVCPGLSVPCALRASSSSDHGPQNSVLQARRLQGARGEGFGALCHSGASRFYEMVPELSTI